jgi:hypothetical protein
VRLGRKNAGETCGIVSLPEVDDLKFGIGDNGRGGAGETDADSRERCPGLRVLRVSSRCNQTSSRSCPRGGDWGEWTANVGGSCGVERWKFIEMGRPYRLSDNPRSLGRSPFECKNWFGLSSVGVHGDCGRGKSREARLEERSPSFASGFAK